MPCSVLLAADLDAGGRRRSTLSGQKRSSRMKTRVTRKLASSRMGTTITSCSYTRISAKHTQPLGTVATVTTETPAETYHRLCLPAGSGSLPLITKTSRQRKRWEEDDEEEEVEGPTVTWEGKHHLCLSVNLWKWSRCS